MKKHIFMKKHIVLFILLFVGMTAGAQNFIQIGPTVYPMSKWGASVSGDFKVADLGSRLSFGLGAFAYGNMFKASEDSPNPRKKLNELYVAPQASLHCMFTKGWDGYLRGGAGALFTNAQDNKFLYNVALGTGFTIGNLIGLYVEAGLPFSSVGLRFSL